MGGKESNAQRDLALATTIASIRYVTHFKTRIGETFAHPPVSVADLREAGFLHKETLQKRNPATDLHR
jgi:hypothetical protein